ncbi:MAG: LptF/LptG family permease [Burkholderiales bacterium]|nr:LptF/LptG family permease [Phycisphaerae bacterium]
MKILTRYILISYIKNYLISLFVLVGLYMMLDMIFNFDEFAVNRQEGGGALQAVGNVAEYYFYQSFMIFAQLSGVVPVAAAAFTFLRLARFNELTAMMAAGMHLVRVAAPAIFCAVIASLVLPLVNQELIIPNIIAELTRARSEQADTKSKSFPIQNMQEGIAESANGANTSRLLFAARYDPPSPTAAAEMTEMIVLSVDWDQMRAEFVSAPKATFDPAMAQWNLEKGTHTTGLGIGQRNRRVQPVAAYSSNITPEEISLYRSGDFVNMLSTSRINELLERTGTYGTNDLLRVKHARLAQLLVNIIMVLLAISSVLIREQGQFRYSVMKCIILVGLCMATVFMCQNFANNPPAGPEWADRWPALMAWVPIFIFGPLSVFLMDRVKT